MSTDPKQKAEEFKNKPEYKALATGQGLTSSLFKLKTDSIKAFESICKEAEKDAKYRVPKAQVGPQ